MVQVVGAQLAVKVVFGGALTSLSRVQSRQEFQAFVEKRTDWARLESASSMDAD